MVTKACHINPHSYMVPIQQKESIPILKYDQIDCPICLEPLQHPQKKCTTLTACHHAFHQTCILNTMQAKYDSLSLHEHTNLIFEQIQASLTCPLCKKPILNEALLYHPQLVKVMLLPIIYCTQLQAFDKILEHIDDVNLIKYFNGNSLLHIVVEAHNHMVQKPYAFMYMAKALLQKNIDVHTKNNKAWTPLHIAVNGHNTTMIQLLLEHINSNTPDHKKVGPFTYSH